MVRWHAAICSIDRACMNGWMLGSIVMHFEWPLFRKVAFRSIFSAKAESLVSRLMLHADSTRYLPTAEASRDTDMEALGLNYRPKTRCHVREKTDSFKRSALILRLHKTLYSL